MRRPVFVLMLWLGIASAATAAEPVTLTAEPDPVPLAGHIEYLRDDDGALTLDDVRSPKLAAQFVRGDSASFSFGFTKAAYWYRVVLSNPSPTPDTEWVLEMELPTLDYIDVHLLRSDGRTETILTGDRRQTPPQQLPHHRHAIPIHIAGGQEVAVYARVINGGAQTFSLTLSTQSGFRAKAVTENILYGAFFGIMLVMALYNLVIWLKVRDRAYLYLVLSLVSYALYSMVYGGYARQYGNLLSDDAPVWISTSFPACIAMTGIFSLLFAREFIQIRLYTPRTDRFVQILIVLEAAALLLQPVISYALTVQMLLGLISVSLLTLTPTLVWLAYRGVIAARLYLLSFGVFIFVTLIAFLQLLGLLPGIFFNIYAFPIGLSTAATLLSLALADRLNSERREKERLGRLRNFFAPQVAEAILDEGGGSLLAPKRREVTVVFTDLRGFTTLAAQSEPEDVIRVLREYHEAVVETTAKHGGNVEHIAGDGVMIYFNAPLEVTEPEARAVRMAFELSEQFETLWLLWRKRGHELGVGIGMACGFATVGAVGAKGRMDYSCIGTVTNLAARLCSQAKHGQILAPQQLVSRVESLVTTEPLGEQELKGMPKPVAVFNLKGLNAPADDRLHPATRTA